MPGPGIESWGIHLYCLRHPEFAGPLRVEDKCGELAGQIEREAFSDEDQLAASSDDDRAFAGRVDLLLIGRVGWGEYSVSGGAAGRGGAFICRVELDAGVFAAQFICVDAAKARAVAEFFQTER